MPIRESFSVMSSPHVIPNPQMTATIEFFKNAGSRTHIFFNALVQCSLKPHGQFNGGMYTESGCA